LKYFDLNEYLYLVIGDGKIATRNSNKFWDSVSMFVDPRPEETSECCLTEVEASFGFLSGHFGVAWKPELSGDVKIG
jgi:hypothetical protein